jgi:hypothetical protein
MPNYYGPKIATDGLLICIDAGNNKSNKAVGGTALSNIANMGGSPVVVNGTTSNGIVSIDGISQYISIGDSVTSATLSPSVATFDIWFKPSSAVTSNRASSLISRGNYNNAGGFFIHLYTKTVANNAPTVAAFFSYSTTTSYSFNGTSEITLTNGFNNWYHVAVVADANITMYINGQYGTQVARNVSNIIYGNGTINTAGDTNIMVCSTLSYLPAYSDTNWNPYKGDFGMMNMWNRRLSAQEILDNYNANKTRFGL